MKFPSGATLIFSLTPHPTHPVQEIQKRKLRLTLCPEGQRPSCALRPSPPSFWFHCFSGPRFDTFTRSNPASGPEFLSPLHPIHPKGLSLPPLLSTTTLLAGGYMQCTYAQYILSRALSIFPPPPLLVGPGGLVPQHLRCHPSSLVCKGALVLYYVNP